MRMKAEAQVWFDQAKEQYDDMVYLYEGRRYSMAVYCAHQSLEKLLKAAIVEFGNISAPKIHKLDELALQSTLPISDAWREDLAEITRHFWRVRYPDFQTYTYTSKESVSPTIDTVKELFLWISKQFNQ